MDDVNVIDNISDIDNINDVDNEDNVNTLDDIDNVNYEDDDIIKDLENAFAAISKGVQNVIIGKAEDLSALINHQSGTTIQ